MPSKVFDTNTLKGMKAAEAYKTRLQNKYDKVMVMPVGMDRVCIEAKGA